MFQVLYLDALYIKCIIYKGIKVGHKHENQILSNVLSLFFSKKQAIIPHNIYAKIINIIIMFSLSFLYCYIIHYNLILYMYKVFHIKYNHYFYIFYVLIHLYTRYFQKLLFLLNILQEHNVVFHYIQQLHLNLGYKYQNAVFLTKELVYKILQIRFLILENSILILNKVLFAIINDIQNNPILLNDVKVFAKIPRAQDI